MLVSGTEWKLLLTLFADFLSTKTRGRILHRYAVSKRKPQGNAKVLDSYLLHFVFGKETRVNLPQATSNSPTSARRSVMPENAMVIEVATETDCANGMSQPGLPQCLLPCTPLSTQRCRPFRLGLLQWSLPNH